MKLIFISILFLIATDHFFGQDTLRVEFKKPIYEHKISIDQFSDSAYLTAEELDFITQQFSHIDVIEFGPKIVRATGHFYESHAFSLFDTNYELDSSRIKQVKTLSKKDTQDLFKIMYKIQGEQEYEFMCYMPHHVVCFYDQSNNIIAAFEVCFACQGYHLFGTIPDVDFSEVNYELLYYLFAE